MTEVIKAKNPSLMMQISKSMKKTKWINCIIIIIMWYTFMIWLIYVLFILIL